MCEQDVYVTNDPWMGTGHLHDITMVSLFFAQPYSRFFRCTAHVVDIGGRGFGDQVRFGDIYALPIRVCRIRWLASLFFGCLQCGEVPFTNDVGRI